MARVYLSDTQYTGKKQLKNLLDFLDTSGKVAYLQNILTKEGLPTSLVNLTNVDYISKNYSNYLSYVGSNGGEIGSYGQVIKALSFAQSQSIDYNNFQAFGAIYGYKKVDGFVSQLFSLGANNILTINVASSVDIQEDAGRKVLNFIGATSAFSSNKALSMMNGLIIATSCKDTGNVNTNSMRGVVLSGASNTTSSAHTELGHNLPTGNFAKHYVTNALATITDNEVGDVGYSGLATIAKVGTTAKLFKNGTTVATGGTQTQYTLPNTYLFIANGNVANNKLYQSWVVFGESETLAQNLSSYLNSV